MNSKKLPKKVTTTLFGVEVSGYKLPNGDWVMGIRDVSRMLQKAPSSLSDFIKSNYLKQALGKDFSLSELSLPNSPPIKVVPLNVVSLFIKRQAILGNEIADSLLDALMNQSLELRLEASLPEDQSLKEQVHKVTNKYLDVQSERQRQKQNQIQNYFQMWCEAKGMNPAYVHDYITSSVIGRKAKDSRELPLYSGMNFFVGLDHYQEDENEEMNLISQIKDKLPKKFPRKKKDYNYKNYVDDVIQEITV